MEEQMKELMATINAMRKENTENASEVKGIRSDLSEVKKDVASISSRVDKIEKGEKPKQNQGASATATDHVAEKKEEEQKKAEEKDQVLTPAKTAAPIVVKKLSPTSEDAWSQREAMGDIANVVSDTPRLDVMVAALPPDDMVLEDLPFIKPKERPDPRNKKPEPEKMAEYDLQILATVSELEKMVLSDSRGRGSVRGARASRNNKLTEIRKIMTHMGVKDPCDV